MSILSEIFGECPQLKIVETFAENYNDKLYVADIVRMTDVSKVTVNSHINKLLKEGVVEKKDKVGKIQFYQLNMNNSKAKIILLLERFIVSERLGKLVSEDVEDKIEEKIEPSTSKTEISVRTEYKKESTNSVGNFYPFLDPNRFGGHAVNIGDGYSIIDSGETVYECRR